MSLSGAPHASSKNFRDNFLHLSTHKWFPEPKICLFKSFVQRRWVYSVVETTSYVKIKKSETYRKDFRSQTDKLKRINTLKIEPHLLHKRKTDDKTRSLCLIHPLFNKNLSHQTFFLPSAIKQTFAPSNYCPNPLLFHPSFVQLIFCSNFLLFYTSIVQHFCCSNQKLS